MRTRRVTLVLGVLVGSVVGSVPAGCGSASAVPPVPASTVTAATATVVARYPHDPAAFTEGLVFGSRNHLYESSGQYGSSDIREVDPTTGRVLERTPLAARYFGEGIGLDHGVAVQLTWREGVALTYDESTLRARPTTYQVANEGWGLSLDPAQHRWVQSDGTATLTFRNESTFAAIGHRSVTLRGRPVTRLNELEVVGGSVWANVWKTDQIDRIDLATGRVTETVDLSRLVPPGVTDPDSVLNGLAHRPGDPVTRLWVTGKRWPTMYVIDISS